MKFIPLIIFISVISLVLPKDTLLSAYNMYGYSDTLSKCPVTGDEISKGHISFKYADKTIKFCNEGCVLAFKKEPAKFTEHLLCMPCNDPDGKKDINAVHNGVKYYFCSGGCREKFTAKPDEYLKEFKEDK